MEVRLNKITYLSLLNGTMADTNPTRSITPTLPNYDMTTLSPARSTAISRGPTTEMNPMNATAPLDSNNGNLPPGYCLQEAPDGSKFAVPRFLLPAARSAVDVYNMKNILHTDEIESKVVPFPFR